MTAAAAVDEPVPADERAEQDVLGLMMQGAPALIADVLEVVGTADFWRPAHATVFDAITRLHQRGAPTDPVAVGDELRRAGELVRIGGAPYLHTVLAGPASSSSAVYSAEIVRERAELRGLIATHVRSLQIARDPAGSIEEKRERIRAAMLDAHAAGAAPARARLLTGGEFIHGAAEDVPALWGAGDDVLWAEGEPLLITGPTGVGKTTVCGQLLAARLGLIGDVLGLPVTPGKRVLYLAMDRPAQIARAHSRLLRQFPPEVLDDRLVVWKGPPPADLARHPERLLEMADQAGADTVFLDSLKDAAKRLTEEETGQGLNEAMQLCVAAGVETVALHHQRKSTGDGKGKPTSISDVYGSSWITAGCGSVVLLWGSPGDLVVELSHLKQPAGVVGPLRLVHNPDAGTTTVGSQVDVLDVLDHRPRAVREIAMSLRTDEQPVTDPEVERVRRRLDRLVREGAVQKLPTAPGAPVAYVRLGPIEGVTQGVTGLFGAEQLTAS